MPQNTIAMASDHAGVELKAKLKLFVEQAGLRVIDLGTQGSDSVDYPDMADRVAAAIANEEVERGILICGTGIGISIAANRHRQIRAALCHDVTSARLARQHNDANVLAIGARVVGLEVVQDCVKTFLNTEFEGGRHTGRVAKLG